VRMIGHMAGRTFDLFWPLCSTNRLRWLQVPFIRGGVQCGALRHFSVDATSHSSVMVRFSQADNYIVPICFSGAPFFLSIIFALLSLSSLPWGGVCFFYRRCDASMPSCLATRLESSTASFWYAKRRISGGSRFVLLMRLTRFLRVKLLQAF